MDTSRKKIRLLKFAKAGSKVLIFAGLVFFIIGLLKMFLIGMDQAWVFYILGWVFFAIGLISYVLIRVFLNILYAKCGLTPEEKKQKKKKMIIHFSLDGLLISVLIAVCFLLPSLGKKAVGENYYALLMSGIGSYAKSVDSSSAQQIKERKGFMKGICHVDTSLKADWAIGANIHWDRLDVSMVAGYDSLTKKVTPGANYLSQKQNWQSLVSKGLTIMGVTPYPDSFTDLGFSVTDGSGDEAIKAIAQFYLEDLKDVVKVWQISNELQLTQFAKGLDFAEASRFQGIQLEAMFNKRAELGLKDDILLGYNVAGGDFIPYNEKIKTYREKYCDYVGLDLYMGCFENLMHSTWFNEMFLRSLYNSTHLPIIEAEFGYMGGGKAKSTAEKNAFLTEKYGYSDEATARKDVMNLIYLPQFPTDLRNEIAVFAKVDSVSQLTQPTAEKALFDTELANHFYQVLQAGYYLSEYPHTREGQAKFFKDIIPSIRSLPFVIGAFCYDIQDSTECYLCGQADCPVETSWGLVDANGEYKPSWYAVKEAFAI